MTPDEAATIMLEDRTIGPLIKSIAVLIKMRAMSPGQESVACMAVGMALVRELGMRDEGKVG